MKLVELLAPERILLPLKAKGINDAAGKLAGAIAESVPVAEPQQLRDMAKNPADRFLTAGSQAFLIHLRTPLVSDLVAAMGVSEQPLAREKGSDQTARIIMVLAAPPRDSSARLRAVSAFSLVLSRQELIDQVLQAKDPGVILSSSALAGLELPPYLTVHDVMDGRRIAVRPETTLGEASRLMFLHDVPLLPVVSETNEVLGAVTHRDLLKNLLPVYVKRLSSAEFRRAARSGESHVDPHQIPVRDIMDRSVLCVTDDQTLAEVAAKMVHRNLEQFPVVHEGALVGSLSRADIVKHLLGQ